MAGGGNQALVVNNVAIFAALYPRVGEVPARIRLKYGDDNIIEYRLDEDYPYYVED